MTNEEYIALQDTERSGLLTELHHIIVANDPTVTATVGTMMGKQMILYNAPGTFKYGLASVKKHMLLHVQPMYGNALIYDRYKELLPDASFQKGCINFQNREEMLPEIVTQLIKECSAIDMAAIREAYLQSRKSK